MAQRRGSGEGTIARTPDGKGWVAILELPRHPSGKRNRKKRRARTRAEAQRILRVMKDEFDKHGSLPDQSRSLHDTVTECYEQVRISSKKAKTTLDRDRLFMRRLRQYFGNRKTSSITVIDCDSFLSALAAGQIGEDAELCNRDHVRRARSFLSAALKNDLRRGYINRNVALDSVLPATTENIRPKRALSSQEWLNLYSASIWTTKLIVDLGGRHGLRPQEIRSTTWEEIDIDAKTLSVINQFDSENEFVDVKTIKSTRTIPLHQETIDLLIEWQKQQERHSQKAQQQWVERGLVVTTRFGTAINKDNQRRSLQRLCTKTGIENITPYELRHTAITHQIEKGYTASQVADWAGTSEKMIHLHYRHKIREIVNVAPVDHK